MVIQVNPEVHENKLKEWRSEAQLMHEQYLNDLREKARLKREVELKFLQETLEYVDQEQRRQKRQVL